MTRPNWNYLVIYSITIIQVSINNWALTYGVLYLAFGQNKGCQTDQVEFAGHHHNVLLQLLRHRIAVWQSLRGRLGTRFNVSSLPSDTWILTGSFILILANRDSPGHEENKISINDCTPMRIVTKMLLWTKCYETKTFLRPGTSTNRKVLKGLIRFSFQWIKEPVLSCKEVKEWTWEIKTPVSSS